MATQPEPVPNLDFEIGADVQCHDGGCGKLSKVVIDPVTDRVTGLIIERGFLEKDYRVVPTDMVAQAAPDTIRLAIEGIELQDYPEYNELEYAIPSDDWRHERYPAAGATYWTPPYRTIVNTPVVPMLRQKVQEGIPSTMEAIGSGTRVRNLTDDLGTVDHVLTDRETGAITHLAIRRPGLFSTVRILPITAIDEIDDEGIIVTLSTDEVGDLPEYRPHA